MNLFFFAKLKDNLIAKNIAYDVATSLIENLDGSVMGTFQSIASTVKDALTQSLKNKSLLLG